MRKYLPLSLLIALPFALGVRNLNNDIKEVKAASNYSKASLPTTIDLNPVEEGDVRGYYNELVSLENSEKTGTNLLKALKPILSNNQKYYSYDISSGNDIWKMYEITDRDWEKSPASEISGYDANTNIITGYKYKATGVDPYIHALYVNRDVDNQMTAYSNHNQTAWGINREHIWPKSHGFDDDNAATSGARGDPMHLWAGDGYTNNTHNNLFYGYVDTSKTYTDCGDKAGFEYAKNNYKGTSKTLGTGTVFEPQDCDKGDIARAVFYMVARYNNYAGNDNTIDVDNPNLCLSNEIDMRVGTSTASDAYSLGILDDLLEWNKIDPVDEYEIKRNDILYRNFTNNRNPFIDFPEWADLIWGSEAGTSYANPTTDGVNGEESGIKIDNTVKTNTKLDVNGTTKIKLTTDDNSKVTWSMDKTGIISINKNETDSGEELVITAVSNGTVKLTAKAKVNGVDYEKSWTFTVAKASNNTGFNFEITPTMLIIAGIALVVLIIIVILFVKFASKKTKKKVMKTIKKTGKKTTKRKK